MSLDLMDWVPIYEGPRAFNESVTGTDVLFTLSDGRVSVHIEGLDGVDGQTAFVLFHGWYTRKPTLRVKGGFNPRTSLGWITVVSGQ